MKNAPRIAGSLPLSAAVCALGLVYVLRPLTSLSIPGWQQNFQIPTSQVTSWVSLSVIVAAGFSLIAGKAIETRWRRLILPMALGLAGFGAIGLGLLEENPSLWVGFLLFVGPALGLASASVTGPGIAACCGLRLGAGTGWINGSALALQMLLLLALSWVMTSFGLKESFLVLGFLCLAALPLVFVALDLPNPPRWYGENSAESSAVEVSSMPLWPIYIAHLFCGFTATGLVETFLMPYALGCGLPPQMGAANYILMAFFGFVGLNWAGRLSETRSPHLLLAGLYLVRALSMVLLFGYWENVVGHLVLFAVIFGLVDLATLPILAKCLGSDESSGQGTKLGIRLGLLSLGHGVFAGLGALTGGVLFDIFGRYQQAWWLATAMMLVAAVLVGFSGFHNSAARFAK